MSAGTPETGLVIVTHGQIGQSMIEVAEFILDQSLSSIRFISYLQAGMPKANHDEIRQIIASMDSGQGVLVMTDLGGASPCNHVSELMNDQDLAVVTGLNLAMLLRVWNYRAKSFHQLATLATEGAIRDVKEFHP